MDVRKQARPRLYLETSVWNFAFAHDAPARRDVTLRFFEEVRRGEFDIFISDVVLDEIRAAAEPKRIQLESLVSELEPGVLENSVEAQELAGEMVETGLIPGKFDNDAAHIAISVVENMDVLLSWNFKHIVKVTTRRVVSAMSRVAGYKEIEIATPEEVLDDEGE